MNIFDLQATISLNSSGFETGVQNAQTAFGSLGDTIKGTAIGKLAADAVESGASALVDFGKAALQTGMSFDESMANVAAISGATGDDLQALRDKAKEMGATTKFTAKEAADAFTYMAMAGWEVDDMLGGIEGIMSLAAASGEDLATTSDIVTDALTAFGLSAEDSGHFGDVLAAASSAANTNVGLMGETFKYVAPLAGAMGYSIEDMATAIGIMANSGIKGSQAGTALRMAISQLANPSEKVAAALDDLGLSAHSEAAADFAYDLDDLRDEMSAVDKATKKVADAQDAYNKSLAENGAESDKTIKAQKKLADAQDKLYEANAKLNSAKEAQVKAATWYNAALQDENGNALDFSTTVAKLQQAFSGLTEAEQAEYAATIFGQNAMSGMLALVNAAPEDIDKLSDAAWRASLDMDNISEAVANSGVEWNKYADKMWSVEDVIDDLAYNFTEAGHSAEEMQEYLHYDYDMSWEDAAAAVEAFQVAMDESAGTSNRMAEIMNSNLPGAITIMNSALDGVKTAVYEKFSKPLKEAIVVATEIFSDLATVIDTEGIGAAFESIGSIIAENVGPKIDELTEKIPWLGDAFDTLSSILSGIGDAFKPFADAVSGAFSEAMPMVTGAVKEFLEAFQNSSAGGAIESIAAGAKDLLSAFGTVAADAVEMIAGGISSFLSAFNNSGAADVIGTIASGAGDLLSAFGSATVDVVEGIASAVGSFMDAFDDKTVADIISPIAAGAKDLIGAFGTVASDIIADVGKNVGDFLDLFAESSVPDTIADIAKHAGELFGKLQSAGAKVIEGVGDAISGFLDVFDKEAAVSTLENLAGFIGDLFAPFTEFLGDAIQAAADAFADLAPKIADFAAELSNEFIGKVNEIIDDFDKWGPIVADVAVGLGTMMIVTSVAAGIKTLTTVMKSGKLAAEAMAVAQKALNTVLNATGGPIGLVIGLLAGIAAAFITAYQTNDEFREKVDETFQKIKDAFAAISEWLSEFFTSTIPEAFNKVVEWFKGLPAKFKEIGGNIVAGVKEGFLNAWQSFKDTVSNTVNGIVDSVKGFLGIGSPSKVFAEIGKFTVQGMEIGWAGEFGRLERQIDRDMASINGTAQIGFENSALGKSSAAGIAATFAAMDNGGRGGDPIQINLVLDGDVAASALYDPLRRTAFQRGQNMTEAGAYA